MAQSWGRFAALIVVLEASEAGSVCSALTVLGCANPDGVSAGNTAIANAHASVSPAMTASSAPSQVPAAPECQPTCTSLERCESGRCRPSCPKGEVFVPATPAEGFTMGNGKPGDFNQKHTVVLTRPFCVDETEVTVAAYRS